MDEYFYGSEDDLLTMEIKSLAGSDIDSLIEMQRSIIIRKLKGVSLNRETLRYHYNDNKKYLDHVIKWLIDHDYKSKSVIDINNGIKEYIIIQKCYRKLLYG